MRYHPLLVLALAATSFAPAVSSPASGCAADPRVARIVDQWSRKVPIDALAITSTAQARCFKRQFVQALSPRLGPVIGYKVGFYSKAARAAYHTNEPRFGYLLSKMMLPDGAQIPAAYAVKPTWESDLLLVVEDEGINGARGRADIYKHLRGFRPFIELPSGNFGKDVKATADQIEALNVGARYGVMAPEQPLPQTPEGMNGLVNFSVETSITGPEPRIETGKAIDTLGDVLDIALFARDQALAEGHRLKAGDLISIGVVTPARAPVAGQTLQVRYHILPAPSVVSVHFR